MIVAMRRVLIIGPCGAGKSRLAIELAAIAGLPLYHMDRLHWKPGWVESTREELIAKLKPILAGDRWIIDGNYSGTLDLRLERADTVILLDLRPRIYRWRVLKRWWTHRGRTRPDLTEGCPEKIDWEFLSYVWRFDREARPRLLAKLDELLDDQAFIRLTSPRQVRAFMEGITH
jgi:adenylate kinase family enzyme